MTFMAGNIATARPARLASGASVPAEFEGAADGGASLAEFWRFAQGVETAAELKRLRFAAHIFFKNRGHIPLDRILHLPCSTVAFQKALRNEHLCRAAALIHVPAGVSGTEQLHATWRAFVTRGLWVAWRDDDVPPADAGELFTELFYASRFTAERDGSRYLDVRQLRRIVGHIFRQKCQAAR